MNLKRVARRLTDRAPREGVGHTPPLLSVWVAAAAAIIVAGGLGFVLYYFVRRSPAVFGAAPIEVLKITLTLMAALGAVLTGVYAYRKQRLSEGAAARADADQFTQRYSSAAEQLGHEKAAVRLAGVYAMGRLADDWSPFRGQCINVLCAYLRMPSEDDGNLSEREVRSTIVRTITGHLRGRSRVSWVEDQFDFTGAVLYDADFSGATFGRHTSFSDVTFCGSLANFKETTFQGNWTGFGGATFSAGTTLFAGATFAGGEIRFMQTKFVGRRTFFEGALFSGENTDFRWATFSGKEIDFGGAIFSGEKTNFKWATFSGATTADKATVRASFVGETVEWGPISPRLLPSLGAVE